jgi:hypothetical protein
VTDKQEQYKQLYGKGDIDEYAKTYYSMHGQHETVTICDRNKEITVTIHDNLELGWQQAKNLLLKELSQKSASKGLIIFNHNHRLWRIDYKGTLKITAL